MTMTLTAVYRKVPGGYMAFLTGVGDIANPKATTS